MSRIVWAADAERLDVDDEYMKILYQNRATGIFLDSASRKLCVSATKGWGKTFLLKVKRKMSEEKEGIVCIPNGKMIDSLPEVQFNNTIINFLSDYQRWIFLWEICIGLSILKNVNVTHSDELNDTIKRMFGENDVMPSNFITRIMKYNHKEIDTIFNLRAEVISAITNQVKNGVYIFIDSVDEAFKETIALRERGTSRSRKIIKKHSIWEYAQLGLLEAARNILKYNEHIKVFFSIREEALTDLNNLTDTAQQLRDYIIKLEYSDEDLRNMFKLYVENETEENLRKPELRNINPVEAFFGLSQIDHAFSKTTENVFDYICRHTLRRPRDIMTICGRYLEKNLGCDKDIVRFREYINKSATQIVDGYLTDMAPFLEYNESIKLHKESTNVKEEIISFLKLLPLNALSIRRVKSICKEYNKDCTKETEGSGKTCTFNCYNCHSNHIISVLYNLGLVGVMKEYGPESYYLNFLLPGKGKFGVDEARVPESKYYFIHSILNNLIQNLKSKVNEFDRYVTTKEMIVGHGNKVSQSFHKTKIFLSSTSLDFENERLMIKKRLEELGYNVLMHEEGSFNHGGKEHSHDICIRVLLECDICLLFINTRASCYYIGNEYESYIKDIMRDESINTNISITWLEFLIAIENGLKTFGFINRDVVTENIIYNANKGEIKVKIGNKGELYSFVNYINRRKNSNWLQPFNDINHLISLIEKSLLKEF